MDFKIEKIGIDNDSLFEDMVFRQESGFEREATHMPVSEEMKKS